MTEAGSLDPIAEGILDILRAIPGRSLSPQEVARSYGEARQKPKDPPDSWRKYLPAVRQQALHLARAGLVEILRKGQPVDPNDFKGVVRLRAK